MMLTSESNELLGGCWSHHAEVTPSLQKKMSAGCSPPRRGKCCFDYPGCGEESQPESAPNGHWRNYWMEDSKLHGNLLPGYWLCALWLRQGNTEKTLNKNTSALKAIHCSLSARGVLGLQTLTPMLRIQGDAQLLRSLLLCAEGACSQRIEKESQFKALIENDLQYRQEVCTVASNSQSR